MKHRKLRIAWSVAWGIVAVLSIALWVRSYWYSYHAIRVIGTSYINCGLLEGQAELSLDSDPTEISFLIRTNGYDWNGSITSVEELYDEWKEGDVPVPPLAVREKFLRGFEFDSGRVEIPLWFLTSLFTAASIAPWLRWSNRFSLRTLLIATTLVAVGLGLIAWLR